MILAKENNLFVIEDNAQLLDVIILLEMEAAKTGAIGHIGTTFSLQKIWVAMGMVELFLQMMLNCLQNENDS